MARLRVDLVLYDRAKGEAAFVGLDTLGEIVFGHTNTGWRKSWSLVAPL